jgi:uncharacterized RmlC-like cupin family protein
VPQHLERFGRQIDFLIASTQTSARHIEREPVEPHNAIDDLIDAAISRALSSFHRQIVGEKSALRHPFLRTLRPTDSHIGIHVTRLVDMVPPPQVMDLIKPRSNGMFSHSSSTRRLLLACGIALIPVFARAQDATIKLPQEITYRAALAGTPEVAVLFGDPTKSGVYVMRVKVPSGMKLMPHWHPDEVRTVVVLSGTFQHGYGDQWDESKLKTHPAGTFFSEPPKAPHFAWAKDGEVVLQITALGPTATTNIEQPKK